MNIAYITVGLAIMSVVGMSAAYLVGDVKKQEVAGNAMGALNQAHILSLQKAKNTETVRLVLTDSGYDLTKGSNLYKCLGGVGLSCQGFCGSTCDSSHLEYKPISNFVTNTVIPGGLSVNTTASFALFCNSNSCDYVSLKVKSQLSAGASSSPFANLARESEFQLPGVFLTDRAQLSFDCANTAAAKIPTGIDLKKLGALCAGPQPALEQCAGNPAAPVGQFLLTSSNPGCPVTNNLDCSSTGVAAIGAMAGQGYCVGAAPVVTTTVTVLATTTSTSTTMLGSILPTGLSLTHTPNSKSFTVNWAAGSGNGGVGGCTLEYQKANSIWVKITTPATVNCDAAGSAAGSITLPGDSWFGGNWSNVPVRLVQVSNSSVIGSLGNLTCTSKTGSSLKTPTVDEDCNNAWDNSKLTSGPAAYCCIVRDPTTGMTPKIGDVVSAPPTAVKGVGQRSGPFDADKYGYGQSGCGSSCGSVPDGTVISFYRFYFYKLSHKDCGNYPGGVWKVAGDSANPTAAGNQVQGGILITDTSCVNNDKWDNPSNQWERVDTAYRISVPTQITTYY